MRSKTPAFSSRIFRTAVPVEIRIVLNISGSTFDPVRQKTMFLNMSVNPYRNGHLESPFTFSQPMMLTIPVAGLNSLLSLSGLSRNNIHPGV